MDHIDTCVIGGGVIGLAVGRALSKHAKEVVVLDQNAGFGQGVSSRNSEVIHAGIYYPKGSLKAKLCLRGKELLYDYCIQRGISHKRCGKLVVAIDKEEIAAMNGIKDAALENGVIDLEYWSQAKIRSLEPAVRAVSALFSPSTGIVDSHGLMMELAADISNKHGQLVFRTKVLAITRVEGNFNVTTEIAGERYSFSTRVLVNAAGLGAQAIAQQCDFLDRKKIPQLYLCKGSYFLYAGKSPFKHLIYPVPEKSDAGLGIHATLDLGGQLKFGPDVEYVDKEDYCVSDARVRSYIVAIKRYFPALKSTDLIPGYAGIRPKLQRPGDCVKDFAIESEADHNIPGFIQMFGIESPGLTSSLAIAEYIENLLIDEY